jgi:hypothetical protein
MKQTLGILIILFLSISCSQKVVPFGLRKTINQMEKNLNDTIKYDFKIAPESVAGTKHHFGLGLGLRNGKGLWSGSMLRTYFRLNGINHPDDMSGIILTTLHRKLNNEPINFREQKKYYKDYWKVAKIGRDTLERYWESKYKVVNRDSLHNIYNSNFSKGCLVLGSVGAWKKRENGESVIDIKMIAKIIDQNQSALKLEIIELEKTKEGYELMEKVGDTVEISSYDVYLIPEK